METQNEKDQDHRTDLAGRRDPGARRTERRRRLRAWRMGDAVFRYGHNGGHHRGAGQELRSAAWPPHYDIWAGYWPKAESGPIADGLNAATKYVATHRPDSLGWGPVEDLGADIVEGVRGVKSKDGPDLIVWGSSTLTSVLLEQGLVDEVLLLVCPVLLGRGKRFFSDTAEPRELALVSTKAAATGVLMNTYRHVGSLRTETLND